LQGLRVPERRDGDIEPRPLSGKRRQVRRHHHGGDVRGAQRRASGIDAEALEHRLQGLFGERRVVERVPGPVEADHEAVADELVLAHALDAGEILDARQRRGGGGRQHQRGAKSAGEAGP
jgi:hypothetical protein